MARSQVTNPKPPSDEDLEWSPGPFAWNPRSEDLRYAGQQGYGIGRGDEETGAARVQGWSIINAWEEQLNFTSALLNNPIYWAWRNNPIRHLIMFSTFSLTTSLEFPSNLLVLFSCLDPWYNRYGFGQLTIIHPTEIAKTILQMIPPKSSLWGYIPIH